MTRLQYVSTSVFESLRKNVHENLERYLAGAFTDLTNQEGWSIPLDLEVDLSEFERLKPETGVEAEVLNSLIVWRALSKLTPSLATESRIWTRLTHVEGLDYSRSRWIKNQKGAAAEKLVETHFFGETRTRYRDDNAIGRLWWNAYVARLAMPDRHFDALKLLLKKADIRSNIVERAWITSRPAIAAGIIRALDRCASVSATEMGFRTFMKAVNANGGGILFEAMSVGEVDEFMDACAAEVEAA
jgi:hypothetical protein